jgi:hypothetical protein
MVYVKAIGSRPCVALVCISLRIWDAPQYTLNLPKLRDRLYHIKTGEGRFPPRVYAG